MKALFPAQVLPACEGNEHAKSKSQKSYWLVLLGASFVFGIAPRAAAQTNYPFGQNPNTIMIPVENGFVDPSTGNLHLEIPIASIPERGSTPFVAKFVYDSHFWQQSYATGPLTWQPTNIANSQGGWRFETPGTRGNVAFDTALDDITCPSDGIDYDYNVFSNFSWTSPDGLVLSFGINTNTATPCLRGNSSGNAVANGYHMYVTSYIHATVYGPDGTMVYPTIKDTNGNYYSSDSNGNVIDTLGRTPITATVNGSQTTYAILNSQNTRVNVVVTTESINVCTAFGQAGVTENCSTSTPLTVIQRVDLPDGTSYSFGYDSGTTAGHYGTLTSITLPATGTVTYTHSIFQDEFNLRYLWVATRSSGGGQWSYAPQVITTCGTSCSEKFTVTQPSQDQQVYTSNHSSTVSNVVATFYTGAGTLLQTVQTDYSPTTGQPIRYTTTLPVPGGNVMKKTELTYDTNNLNNVVTQNDWGFYSGSFPTTQDRKTVYTYLANSNNNLVNRATGITVYQGASNTASSTVTTNYDGAATTSIPGVVNHDDTNFGVSYTPRGNATSVYNNGSTTTLTYDMTGQVTKTTDQNGNNTQYSYANNFFDDSISGPVTHTTSTLTNAYVTTTTLPAPFSWTANAGYYWGDGKAAKTTDQNGQVTTFDYLDPLDRNTQSVFPNGGWALNQYTSGTVFDTFQSITDASPSANCSSCIHSEVALDTLGRQTTGALKSDPDGATSVVTAFDSSSRTHTVTTPYRTISDPTYGLDTYSYDGLGRALSVAHSGGGTAYSYYGAGVTAGVGGNTAQLCSTTTYGYGYPILSVDEAGKKREVWSDGFGRTMEVDEPDASNNLTVKTCYAYDVLNNLLTVAQGSLTRTYTYDSLSRLTAATTPESGTVHYYYTASGGALCSGNPRAVCRRTDARSITATYTYDALNRPTGISYSDTTHAVTYTYDSGTNQKGFRTGMTDASGSATWTYNSIGLVLTEQRTIATKVKTISYTYNRDGTLATITYPSGRIITYTTSNAERVTSAKDVANNIQYAVTASYAPIGALSGVIYGPATGFTGVTTAAAYNNRLEPTTITASSTGGTAQNLSYTFSLPGGNNGSVSSVQNNVNSGLSETFSYDNLNRILSAATTATSGSGCWGQSFGPAGPPPPGPADDAFSNLTQINVTNCTAGALGIIVSSTTNRITTSGFQFDAVGNMTQEAAPNGYGYTYDAENHLTQATGTASGTWSYVYDGNGMRVEKSNPSGGTLYWRATSGAALAETDLNGNITSEYVFFAGQRIARRDSSNNVYYYYTDQVGSTTAITTASGTPCYDATFTPYGEEHNTLNTCSQNYKFTGYERDSETGLDYAFARYYDSRLGRFLSADPLAGDPSNPQTLNRYAYVANNPLNFVDPLGMKRCYVDGVVNTKANDKSACDELGGDWAEDPSSGPGPVPPVVIPCGPANCVAPGGRDSSSAPKKGTVKCTGTATFTAVGGNQAMGNGALYSQYPAQAGGSIQGGTFGTVAVQKGFLGLTTRQLRTFGTQIFIMPSNQALIGQYGGPTGPLSVSDYGDTNIQNTPGVAFDLFRFPTVAAGMQFGRQTMSTTISFPAGSGGICPAGFTKVQ